MRLRLVTRRLELSGNKAFTVLIPLVAAIGLTGCNSKSEATNENLSAAVRQRLEQEVGTCIEVAAPQLPFDLPQRSYGIDPRRNKADALVKAGLLARMEGPYVFPGTQNPVPGFHYSLTDDGKKYERTVRGLAGNVSFCGGKRELVDLYVPAHPPTQVGGRIPTSFTSKVVDAPQWMSDPGMQTAFDPELRLGVQNDDMVLTLTKDGWSATR